MQYMHYNTTLQIRRYDTVWARDICLERQESRFNLANQMEYIMLPGPRWFIQSTYGIETDKQGSTFM